MKVYVLVGIENGYVYGVFVNEDDAWEWGEIQLNPFIRYDVIEKEVQQHG